MDEGQELLDVDVLCGEIESGGTPCRALPNAEAIADFILEEVGANDVILVMSNGSFGGLIQILAERLSVADSQG